MHLVSHLLISCIYNPSEHRHQLERHLDGHACDHTLLSALVVPIGCSPLLAEWFLVNGL